MKRPEIVVRALRARLRQRLAMHRSLAVLSVILLLVGGCETCQGIHGSGPVPSKTRP